MTQAPGLLGPLGRHAQKVVDLKASRQEKECVSVLLAVRAMVRLGEFVLSVSVRIHHCHSEMNNVLNSTTNHIKETIIYGQESSKETLHAVLTARQMEDQILSIDLRPRL